MSRSSDGEMTSGNHSAFSAGRAAGRERESSALYTPIIYGYACRSFARARARAIEFATDSKTAAPAQNRPDRREVLITIDRKIVY